MFCVHCGKSVEHEGKFCRHCGKQVAAYMQHRPNIEGQNKTGIKRFLFTASPRLLSSLGLLMFLLGMSQQSPPYWAAGLIIMIMAVVYASARDRMRGIKPSNSLRIALEIGGILLASAVFFVQPNLYQTSQEEPIALFALTVSIVAYMNLLLKRYGLKGGTRVAVACGSGIALWVGIIYLTVAIK